MYTESQDLGLAYFQSFCIQNPLELATFGTQNSIITSGLEPGFGLSLNSTLLPVSWQYIGEGWLFIQQVFSEHLLCGSSVLAPRRVTESKSRYSPALMQFLSLPRI